MVANQFKGLAPSGRPIADPDTPPIGLASTHVELPALSLGRPLAAQGAGSDQ
jgi:hypothetical protein